MLDRTNITRLEELARDLARAQPSLRLIVIFGSVVSGTPRVDSDVDIAILGSGFWDGLALASALGAELGREPHAIDLATAPEALKFEVARSGVLLFEREPFDWARFQASAALGFFDLAPLRARCATGVRHRLRREARLE